MILVRCAQLAEQDLADGQIRCPVLGCGQVLQRWGHGRARRVRGLGAAVIDVVPRRARCSGCRVTQVLLPAALQPRLADTTEVIGAALTRKADGLGYRQIAEVLERPVSTVRRWLRRARNPDHLNELRQRGTQELIRLNADAFNTLVATGNLLRDTLNMLAAAAWWARHRLALTEPAWTLIGLFTRGCLLTAPG
jgi:hypothetical protein